MLNLLWFVDFFNFLTNPFSQNFAGFSVTLQDTKFPDFFLFPRFPLTAATRYNHFLFVSKLSKRFYIKKQMRSCRISFSDTFIEECLPWNNICCTRFVYTVCRPDPTARICWTSSSYIRNKPATKSKWHTAFIQHSTWDLII